jgi:hypothetical protein
MPPVGHKRKINRSEKINPERVFWAKSTWFFGGVTTFLGGCGILSKSVLCPSAMPPMGRKWKINQSKKVTPQRVFWAKSTWFFGDVTSFLGGCGIFPKAVLCPSAMPPVVSKCKINRSEKVTPQRDFWAKSTWFFGGVTTFLGGCGILSKAVLCPSAMPPMVRKWKINQSEKVIPERDFWAKSTWFFGGPTTFLGGCGILPKAV